MFRFEFRRYGKALPSRHLRDWVYGSIDGTVTTFAVVAGVAGADLPTFIILILGLANLFADGFSMAASNYAGTRAEQEDFDRLKARELEEMRLNPAAKRNELRTLLDGEDIPEQELDRLARAIADHEPLWSAFVLDRKYGLSPSPRHPLRAAVYTFAASSSAAGRRFCPLRWARPMPS
jgi:hypothetical protein